MKKFICFTLVLFVSVFVSKAQVIKISVDTIHQFSHSATITTDMAMKSNSYSIDKSFITETTYTADFNKMVLTQKDFTGETNTYKISKKIDCNCICDFVFEVTKNDEVFPIYVIVDTMAKDKSKIVTYFRWNSFDNKGNPKTFGWFNSSTKL